MSDFSIALPPELVDAIARRAAEETVVALAAARRDLDRVETTGNGRLALSREEAAEALGVSGDYLDRHVLPDVRIVRVGRRRLIPVSELADWVERNAARALGGER